MKIIIGSDHAGLKLKEACINHLKEREKLEIKDVGVFSTASSDYPKIGQQVAQGVSEGEYQRGILVCGTGIGMSITANRYKGVRAALCYNIFGARMSRLHNDANILALGERVLGEGMALEILDVFLDTEFEGGRHKSRIDLIDC